MARCSGSFRRLILYVTIMSRDGRPFLGHVAIVTSTGIDKNIVSRLPGTLASSDPIKGTGQDPTKGHGQQARHMTEINISSNHLCTLFSL
jgi:hypothetical protein